MEPEPEKSVEVRIGANSDFAGRAALGASSSAARGSPENWTSNADNALATGFPCLARAPLPVRAQNFSVPMLTQWAVDAPDSQYILCVSRFRRRGHPCGQALLPCRFPCKQGIAVWRVVLPSTSRGSRAMRARELESSLREPAANFGRSGVAFAVADNCLSAG